MAITGWFWVGGCIALVLTVLAVIYSRKHAVRSVTPLDSALLPVQQVRAEQRTEAPLRPSALAFGSDPKAPAVTITPLYDVERFRSATPIQLGDGLAGRVGALMQAAPSVLVENAHHGRHLMEVAINGELVRAASGEGFRAFALDTGHRIAEHATLFDVANLTKLVDAAAVWQVASVVVAQKHLADISAKLSVIVDGIGRLSTFLDSARRTRISGTHDYLRQAAQALQQGELPQSIRDELESCERELLACQNHIGFEYRKTAQEPAKHTDTAGTEDLTKSAVKKFSDLENLASDMVLCLKTRALAWYVFSLYPGEPKLKLVRRDAILAGVEEFRTLNSTLDVALESDLRLFKAIFNRQTTLEARKQQVTDVAASARERLAAGTRACEEGVSQSSVLLLQHDKPTHLIFEVQDGKVLQVRSVVPEAELKTAVSALSGSPAQENLHGNF